jgi:peroxiredoxin
MLNKVKYSTSVKEIITGLVFIISIVGCNNKANDGSFTVHGNIKNVENQKVILEQVFFEPNKNPEVLDTAELVNGKFEVAGKSAEDGMYRIRLENPKAGYIFINDKASIDFTADIKDTTLNGLLFNTPANKEFSNFLLTVDNKQKGLSALSAEIETIKKGDTTLATKNAKLNNDILGFKNYIIKSIDSASNPMVAIFALGYTRGINPEDLKNAITNLTKKFPTHQGVASIIKTYNEMMVKKDMPKPAPTVDTAASATTTAASKTGIAVGNMAPDFSLADVNGKAISLSSFKGKYVLVDFWASWCGPCRGENPNVVANYTAFKNKNFTILGVSLDEDKAAWIEAIKKDKLTWAHVSDLKGWGNAAARMYGVEAIPFNILLDPTGKIIAKDLRESDLGKKLTEVLGN